MEKEDFMRMAIKDARTNDHRFGAIIVKGDKVISKAGKRPKGDSRFHAETQAIFNAEKTLGRDLEGCTLYATCEPCIMCFYMAWITNISKIVYGATIKDSIAAGLPEIDVTAAEINGKGNNKIKLEGQFLREECLKLLKKESANRA